MQPSHLQNQAPFWVILGTCLSLLLFANSCKSGIDIQPESLTGKWIVVRGEKNGKSSLYLNNGYLHFKQPEILRVNFTGKEEGGTYKLQSGKLSVSGHRDYYIEKFEQDTLVLRFNTNSENTFRIYAVKEKEPVK